MAIEVNPQEVMDAFKDKQFKLHWHGYNDPSDPNIFVNDQVDVYIGKSWLDAVNQFLQARFNCGPKFYYLDYFESEVIDLSKN